MEIREIDKDYEKLGTNLIKTKDVLKYIRESDVSIIFLASDHEKKVKRRLIGGECEKVPDKWKWAAGCDFTITIFEPNVERFDERRMEALMIHELLHIGIEKDGNEEKYFVKPHDYEEFKYIIDEYGIDWSDYDSTGETQGS